MLSSSVCADEALLHFFEGIFAGSVGERRMASQWSTTFALLFVGVFLLLAFFEVSGVRVYRMYTRACVRACVRE
ncbi:MAG: hypothetical protein ACPIOQ_15475 [Promethearchaeia archaeon]